MEWHIECGTGHHECLRQVRSIHKVVLQLRHASSVFLQRHHLWYTLLLSLKRGLYPQQTEYVAGDRIALHRTVHQSCQLYFCIRVLAQRHHLIPVAGPTPVALYVVVAALVRLVGNGDGICGAPLGVGAEFVHHPQRKVNVWARDDVASELQRQALLQHRTNHQQGRCVLRTYVAWYLQQSACQLLASYL